MVANRKILGQLMKYRQRAELIVRHHLLAGLSALAVALDKIRNESAAVIRNLTQHIYVFVNRIEGNGGQLRRCLLYNVVCIRIIGIGTQLLLVDALEFRSEEHT